MSKSKPIPEVAGEMVKRARAGGCEVTENLVESHRGLIGHVKIAKPGEPRAFLVIYISEGRCGSPRRQVAYVESSGQLTQRLADRALRVVLRQIKTEQAQLDALDEHAAAIDEIAARHSIDLGHGDILLKDAGAEPLTCDGPDGCGAVYADSMNHSQGEHERRRREQGLPIKLTPIAERIRNAAELAGFLGRQGSVSFAIELPGESPILVSYDLGRTRIAQDGPTPIPLKVDAVLTLIRHHAALKAERDAEASWRESHQLAQRIDGALIRLAPAPDEITVYLAQAWDRLANVPEIDTREGFMRSLLVVLQERLGRMDADPYADEPPSERPEPSSAPLGCCGHVCHHLSASTA